VAARSLAVPGRHHLDARADAGAGAREAAEGSRTLDLLHGKTLARVRLLGEESVQSALCDQGAVTGPYPDIVLSGARVSFSRVPREPKGQEEAKVMAKPRHAQGSAR
jgi:hypothetical protein